MTRRRLIAVALELAGLGWLARRVLWPRHSCGPLYHGRAEAYSKEEIAQTPCFRCGRPARQQFTICANGGWYVAVCPRCDIDLNALVLCWLRVPNRWQLVGAYRERMLSLTTLVSTPSSPARDERANSQE